MNISELLTQGFQHQKNGEFAQAKSIYETVLQVEPNNPDALYLIGMVALMSGHEQPATQYLIHAVNNGGTQPDLFTNLAKLLRAQNNPSDAHKVLLHGLQLHPDNISVLVMLAILLQEVSQHERALKALLHALNVDANSSEAHLEIAKTYQALGTYDQAELHFQKAIALRPNVTTRNIYGTFLAQFGRENEAIEQFRKALDFDPTSESTLNNFGFHLYALGEIDESIDAFERCLKLNPNNADAHGLCAFPLLLKGEYMRGWEEYEWRFKTPTFPPPPIKLDSPTWQNEPIEGKTILLIGEQGFGDTFQFVRFATQLSSMGAKVFVAAQDPAVELLKSVPGVSQVIAFSDPNIPAHDYHIFMMSLPERLDLTLASIPQNVPYLFPDKDLVATWKAYFSGYENLKVGIVWSGNPDQRNNAKRSCPLSALSPLLGVNTVQLFSLAKTVDNDASPLPPEIIDLGDRINTFSDTAAIIANLDLVISVCTSTAHLAGALGCPVWILLAASADWRWLQDREDSPWYPAARLFRQTKLHDWDHLLQNVAQDLASLERQKLLT